jgi:hypothetical protein
MEDRKGRRLSLDEVNHYMKVARAIRLTIGLHGKVDGVYLEVGCVGTSPKTVDA